MSGDSHATARALDAARARFEAAGRRVAAGPGLDKFAQYVGALVHCARAWAKAEEAHAQAVRKELHLSAAAAATRRVG